MDAYDPIRLFHAVADAASFTVAAQQYDLSRASVSKAIQRLEATLNVRLFTRSTRRVTLTEAGQVFYERTREPLAEIAEAMTSLRDARDKPHGVLRVTAALVFGNRHLVPAVSEFLGRYPDIRLDLTLTDLRSDIIAGGFDVAIRIGELHDSSLVAKKLATTRLVVCAAPAYLKRAGIPKTPQDLRQHNCLVYTYSDNPSRWLFEPDGARGKGETEAVEVSGCARVNNGDALARMAIDGHGIAVLPDFIVGEAVRDGRLAALLTEHPARTLPIHAVYPSRRYMPAKVKVFIEFLAKRYAANTGWGLAGEASGAKARAKRL